MQDLIGKQIGRYTIQQPVGEGGMGMVYRALDTHLDSDVAIKVLVPGRETDAVFLKRFRREAQSMARLMHPNLVKVMDYGEQDGMVYLVMPYVAGGTLSKMTRPMPERQAASMLLPVARALGYAHSQGMIHRDVKPSNVLLTESGEPMVTDFGIAGLLDVTETEQITQTGAGVGTPAYMAPEQIKKDYDHRVDIYSLGVVLYELVTGQQPFKGDTPLDTLVKHATEPLPAPREVNPNISAEVVAVIVKALAKQPDQRYQTMGEFAQALQGMVSGQVGAVVSQDEQVAPMDEDATVDELVTPASFPSKKSTSTQGKNQGSNQRKGLVIGAGIIIVLGLFAGIFFGLKGKQEAQNTAPVVIDEVASNSPNDAAPVPARISDIDDMELMYIPAGEFVMGSEDGDADEAPVHEVFLDAFYMDRLEVTNAQYKECMWAGYCESPANSSYFSDTSFADHPVIYVSWHNANDYCTWAGRRLPTEAEWEKAARGTDERKYPWGNDAPNAAAVNYDEIKGGTSQVGSFPEGASPYGVLDMAGNVWEWTADWYSAAYYERSHASNPNGPISGTERVLRGGGWDYGDDSLRTTERIGLDPASAFGSRGFRCAVGEVDPQVDEPQDIEADLEIGSQKVSSKDDMQQVYVPEGDFMMGSDEGDVDEKPVRKVVLEPFWMDKTEVTNAQYALCVGVGACEKPRSSQYYEVSKYENHPVVHVSWLDAQIYCEWAGRRLPREAEWEKAARGTEGRIYPWGDDPPTEGLLNFDFNISGTTEVGLYFDGASPYGALDMAGNVMEWTADWYDNDYYAWMPGENPPGPVVGEQRVLRGGSWNSIEYVVRSADRNVAYPKGASNTRGFRCAESISN